jgi:hypothetical protein
MACLALEQILNVNKCKYIPKKQSDLGRVLAISAVWPRSADGPVLLFVFLY